MMKFVRNTRDTDMPTWAKCDSSHLQKNERTREVQGSACRSVDKSCFSVSADTVMLLTMVGAMRGIHTTCPANLGSLVTLLCSV